MANHTPKFWTKLFKWFCKDELFEELQGDLEEAYKKNIEELGHKKAKAIYRKEVLKMVRGTVIDLRPFPNYINWAFLNHSFKSSYRALKKHGAYSLLNIVGFAAALTICMFCLNVIYSNGQLDQKFSDKELIYRVNTKSSQNSIVRTSAKTPIPLFEEVEERIPEADKIAILQNGAWGFEAFLDGHKRSFQVSSINRDFFEVFDFTVLIGNTQSIFEHTGRVIITEELMNKHFEPETVIGSNIGKYVISAVIETPKKVSHLDFDILSNDLQNKNSEPFYSSWESFYLQQLYIKKHSESKEEIIQDKLDYISNEVNEFLDSKDIQKSFQYQLEPLSQVASSEAIFNQGDLLTEGRQRIIFILMMILLFVCTFNYTNLAMASGLSRTKEVALKKVMGSQRGALVLQFIAETILLSFTSFFFGLLLFKWLAPDFAAISVFYFQTSLKTDQLFYFIGFTLFTALVSGIIPGLVFSHISILQLFKKTKAKSKLSFRHLKKGMVVFQMILSLFVFIVGYFIYEQARLITNQENALVKENYIAVQLPKTDSTNIVFKNELQSIKGVNSVVGIDKIPFLQSVGAWAFKKSHTTESIGYGVQIIRADTSILNLVNSSLEWFESKPKEFSRPFFLVNEILSEMASDSIASISQGFYSLGDENYYPVLGTIDNLFGDDIALDPNPTAILVYPANFSSSSYFLEITSETMSSTLSEIEDLYLGQYPNAEFVPYFLDDLLNHQLRSFRAAIKAILFVLGSIVVITILGQIGMSMYMAKTREKEIGVRKILGANYRQIINLLLKNTYIQLFIGAVVACPLAYLFYSKVVPSFTVPLKIGVEHFIIGFICFSIIITSLIIIQTWNTTNTQPSETLKNE